MCGSVVLFEFVSRSVIIPEIFVKKKKKSGLWVFVRGI